MASDFGTDDPGWMRLLVTVGRPFLAFARDESVQRRLWEISERLVA